MISKFQPIVKVKTSKLMYEQHDQVREMQDAKAKVSLFIFCLSLQTFADLGIVNQRALKQYLLVQKLQDKIQDLIQQF